MAITFRSKRLITPASKEASALTLAEIGIVPWGDKGRPPPWVDLWVTNERGQAPRAALPFLFITRAARARSPNLLWAFIAWARARTRLHNDADSSRESCRGHHLGKGGYPSRCHWGRITGEVSPPEPLSLALLLACISCKFARVRAHWDWGALMDDRYVFCCVIFWNDICATKCW